MNKGFKKLSKVKPGTLIRFRSGTFAVVTEYSTGTDGLDTYLLETGGKCHADGDEWVAIVDLEAIEDELLAEDELTYPAE